MIYIKYIVFAVFQLFIDVFAMLVTPIVVLFCKSDGNLPSWLSLFQTYDNTCDGDEGYQTLHRFFPNNSGWFQVYANRCGWLWRNPAYGFDLLLGVTCQAGDMLVITGDRATSDAPYHAGSCSWKLYRNGTLIGFQYYLVANFILSKCFRLDAGWKLWNIEQLGGANNDTGTFIMTASGIAQLVFTPGINAKGNFLM